MRQWWQDWAHRQRMAAARDFKSWLSTVLLVLLFVGALLAGAWKVIEGLCEGPNFYAWREVEVLANYRTAHRDIHGWWSFSAPYVRYQYRNDAGEVVEGKFHERAGDTPQAAREAEPGDTVRLRIAVPASDADAHFGLNKQVQEGVFIVLTWLMLWAHGRFRKNPRGGMEVLQLFVAWNLMLWGLMWVVAP